MSTNTDQRLVGISISTGPDLTERGYGLEHLHELMIFVARSSLRLGTVDSPVDLAYGGDLRPGGFSETLFDLAQAESQGEQKGRVYSYLAWPYYLDLSRSDEAQRLNICYFMRVTPAEAGFPEYASDVAPAALEEDQKTLLTAQCISRLREAMTLGGMKRIDDKPAPALAARIILGGKVADYTGIMPGLFEEFMLAQEQQIPTFIAGGYGGASAALADALLDESDALPAVFSLDHQKDHSDGLDALESQYLQDIRITETPQARYARLAQAVADYRADLRKPQGKRTLARNGLDHAENARLMRSQNASEITGLIEKGLQRTWFGKA